MKYSVRLLYNKHEVLSRNRRTIPRNEFLRWLTIFLCIFNLAFQIPHSLRVEFVCVWNVSQDLGFLSQILDVSMVMSKWYGYAT